jgi:hypothetical protein
LFLVQLAVLLEWLLPGDLLLFQQLTELVVELQNEKQLDHDVRYYW